MFEDVAKKVRPLDNCADAQRAVLMDVKSRIDAVVDGGGLSGSVKAELTELSAALDAEKEPIIAATLANTPAASQIPNP